MKNRIYFFTGTGNCLKLACDIASHLDNCELVGIGSGTDYKLEGEYERVGIIFPIYYQGLPRAVCAAIEQINWNSYPGVYCFTVGTYGSMSGNALAQFARLMEYQGAKLHYGAKLIMFSNCVTMYNMKEDVAGITQKSNEDAAPIIDSIVAKRYTEPEKFCGLLDTYYRLQIGMTIKRGKAFAANEDCTSCGICEKICPAKNIILKNGKPEYQQNCEYCMACIQYCPTRAINYKGRTEKRRRYRHPAVDSKTLIATRK